MHIFHKVLLTMVVAAFTAQARASGCDCSCFGVKETVLKADHFEGYKGHGFTLIKDGDNLRMRSIPSRWHKMPADDILITGYKDRGPIHPKLLERIVTEHPYFYVTIMYQHLEVENDWCTLDLATADTARFKVEFRFETGETVTLYHPTDAALFDQESGNINPGALLPSPFGYLQEKKP